MRTLFIIFRRLLVCPLILVFLVLFLITRVAFHIDGTLLQAGFYTDTLRKLDVYNFLYDQALPLALEENQVNAEDLGLGISLTNEQIVAHVKRVLPPEWVRENVEQVVGQMVPYITGQRDEFNVTVRLDQQVEAAVQVAEDIVRDANIYGYLLDDVVRPELERSDTLAGLPYGMTLTPDQVIDGVREVVPKEWLLDQIEEVLDEIIPYATGKREDFTVVIPVQDRAQASLTVLERWLQQGLEGGAYDYLLQEQIAPTIQENLGGLVVLPFGITLTGEEIVAAVSQVLSVKWVSDRVSDVFDAAGPYIIGQTDAFVVEIPLRDRMELAVQAMVETTDAKLQAVFDALPTCTPSQLPTLVLDISLDSPPPCLPPGVGYSQVKSLVGLDITGQLTSQVIDQLPESIWFTERDLEMAVGPDIPLSGARDLLRNGLTFTDVDLQRLVLEQGGQANLDLFNHARRYLREGFTFTDQDLRDTLGPNASDFDRFREGVNTIRGLLFLLLIALAMIAAVIGGLGGRNWWSRLGWAGLPLAISGVLVSAALVAGAAVGQGFTGFTIGNEDVPQVFVDKLQEVQEALVNSFVDSMLLQVAVVAVLGLVMVGLGIYGSFFRRLRAVPSSAVQG
jgi:hypothetical protein